ncbi:MAG: hypothetical protein COB37_05970 [Kordiimonadales bacterium]|nr:MAG: hypothetical protein COB37_05970 [Kordiimonadales bacterium]
MDPSPVQTSLVYIAHTLAVAAPHPLARAWGNKGFYQQDLGQENKPERSALSLSLRPADKPRSGYHILPGKTVGGAELNKEMQSYLHLRASRLLHSCIIGLDGLAQFFRVGFAKVDAPQKVEQLQSLEKPFPFAFTASSF